MAHLITFKEMWFSLKENIKIFLMKTIGHGKLINRDPIFEMALLNKGDCGLSDFPPSIFKIIIWNKEKEPPHIHIKAQGWDVSMLIDDEIILSVNTVGDENFVFLYIVKYIPRWLEQPSYINNNLTNKEVCKNIWKVLND